MTTWHCALELDAQRTVVAGSTAELTDAIGRAADLRIYTEFLHNEHIDVDSPSAECIREVAEFGVTYRVDRKWIAGIMSLRQPIELPVGFGPRPSMSFFLYNQDGTQAIARPYLDGGSVEATFGPAPTQSPLRMPKYHVLDSWDAGTNAPSQNFVYDFDRFGFDHWTRPNHVVPSAPLACGAPVRMYSESVTQDSSGEISVAPKFPSITPRSGRSAFSVRRST